MNNITSRAVVLFALLMMIISSASALVQVTNTPTSEQSVSLVRMSNGDIVGVFNCDITGSHVLCKVKSTDGGATWGAESYLMDSWSWTALTNDGNQIILVANGNTGIYTWTSADGVSFGNMKHIGQTASNTGVGDIMKAGDGYYYVTYSYNGEVFVTRSTDLSSWSTAIQLSSGSDGEYGAALLEVDGTIYAVFTSYTGGYSADMVTSEDGVTWSPQQEAFTDGNQFPSGINLFDIGGKPYVFYTAGSTNYYRYYENGAWSSRQQFYVDTQTSSDALYLGGSTAGIGFFRVTDGQRDMYFDTVQIDNSGGDFIPCSDTDGGISYNAKGTITGRPNIYADDSQTATDHCEQGSQLIEYACGYVQGILITVPYSYNCPNGCNDGACQAQQQKADLIVSSIQYYAPGVSTPKLGDYVGYTITIKNQGTAASVGPIKVNAYLNNNNLRWEGFSNDFTIAPGATYTESQYAYTTFTQTGNNVIKVKVDSENVIAESNENNNEASVNVDIASSQGVCTDSDGGKSHAVKGYVTKDNGATKHEDSCSHNLDTDTMYLYETYCDSSGSIQTETYVCQGTCEYGACNEEVTCTDSDNGRSYFMKGTVIDRYSSSTDVCTNQETELVVNEGESKQYHGQSGNVVVEVIDVAQGGNTGTTPKATLKVNGVSKQVEAGKLYTFGSLKVFIDKVYTESIGPDSIGGALIEFAENPAMLMTLGEGESQSMEFGDGESVTVADITGYKVKLKLTDIPVTIKVGSTEKVKIGYSNLEMEVIESETTPGYATVKIQGASKQVTGGKTYTIGGVAVEVTGIDSEKVSLIVLDHDITAEVGEKSMGFFGDYVIQFFGLKDGKAVLFMTKATNGIMIVTMQTGVLATFKPGEGIYTGDDTYIMEIIGVDTIDSGIATARIKVNGEAKDVQAAKTYTVGGEKITVTNIFHYTSPVDTGTVDFQVNAYNVLKENFCTGNLRDSELYTCPYGCQDGACVGEAPATDHTIVCTDSDRGDDFYTKGTTVKSWADGSYSDSKATDYCALYSNRQDRAEQKVEQCDGPECYVEEFFCKEGVAASLAYHCPYGCDDGACIEKPVLDSECSDSDGGTNYFVKGSVKSADGEEEDACLPGNADLTIAAGESTTLTIGNEKQLIEVLSVAEKINDGISAKVRVNGETKEVSGGNTYTIGGIRISIQEIYHYTAPVDTGAVSLVVPQADLLVKEYYCDSGASKSVTYRCNNGCSEGRCISDDEIVTLPEEQKQDTCEGCQVDERCLPIGVRTSDAFCSLKSTMQTQLLEGQQCVNNFECRSNLCIDDMCTQPGFFKRIMLWFSTIFG